ncbi:MAG: dockerin type I domain-containing protein, partial [Pirellulaceae bacterium]|nr:dockerin type I domain-containing protein [Pirellulaceae bacterium]
SNTDDLGNSLTVITASDDLTELQVANSWDIPSGAASAVITIDAIDDLILDGTQTVALSATASGYVALAVDTIDVLDHETWINPFNQLDVTADSNVLPDDALAVINAINTDGARKLPDRGSVDEQQVLFVDVNGDGWLAPGDALFVINYLNASSDNDGEGEWLGVRFPQQHPKSEPVNPDTIHTPQESADLVFQTIQHWPTTAAQPSFLGRNIEQSPKELETPESLIDQFVNDISEQWQASSN